jgi:hypothetical protein
LSCKGHRTAWISLQVRKADPVPASMLKVIQARLEKYVQAI